MSEMRDFRICVSLSDDEEEWGEIVCVRVSVSFSSENHQINTEMCVTLRVTMSSRCSVGASGASVSLRQMLTHVNKLPVHIYQQ